MSIDSEHKKAEDHLLGARIENRYHILEVIGRGGLGTVYWAQDERLSRVVAVKVLRAKHRSDLRLRAMFENEARITAKLHHPGIVQIYDFGQFSGSSYMVSEFIQGRSLKQVLAIRRHLQFKQALHIVHAVAGALQYAHSLGVIHLDVKPSNILLSDDGRVLLSDFGLARMAGQSVERDFVVGTIAYMSPEQASGQPLNASSDIYSLGIVLYELLVGQRPSTQRASPSEINATAVPWLDPLGSEIPDSIAKLVNSMLVYETHDRVPEMNAVIECLRGEIESGLHVTPSIVLDGFAEATPADDTGVFNSQDILPKDAVLASYRVKLLASQPDDSRPQQPEPYIARVPFASESSHPEPMPARQDLEAAELLSREALRFPSPDNPLPGSTLHDLVIRETDGKTTKVPLDRDRLTLGRSSASELCYADDAGLSRQHMALTRINGQWHVEDLGSKNGTLVNGQRISRLTPISIRDRITVGHLEIEFASGASDANRAVVFVEPNAIIDDESSTAVASLSSILGPAPVGSQAQVGSPQMRALIRAGRELAGHRPLDELFQVIMDLSTEAVIADRGVLMTLEGDELKVRASRGDGFRISTTVRDRVLRNKESLLVRDAQADRVLREDAGIVEQGVRSVIAVPLQTNDRVIGLIYVDSPHLIREFTREDLNLLTVMANVAAIRIEHARLNEIEEAERAMAREMQQAALIQRGLMPEKPPTIAGVDVAACAVPSRTVGGDYYDFFQYSQSSLGFVIADVAGRGVPAALLASAVQAQTRVIMEEHCDLASAMRRLNRHITSSCTDNRFVTLFACILDIETGELSYANAGHVMPMIVRANGHPEILNNAAGFILGILSEADYTEARTRLEVGDVLVLFSDGLTEACDVRDQEFGEEAVAEIVAAHRTHSSAAIVELLRGKLMDWTAGYLADDLTFVVVRRLH
jgi:phosphoserine phosphatase RsbU/P